MGVSEKLLLICGDDIVDGFPFGNNNYVFIQLGIFARLGNAFVKSSNSVTRLAWKS